MHTRFPYLSGKAISILSGGAASMTSLLWLSYNSQAAMRESPETASNYTNSNNTTNDEKYLKIKTGIKKSLIDKSKIETLRNKGVLVIDNVLNEEEIIEVRKEIAILMEKSVSFEMNGHNDVETRTDSVFWVTDPESTGLIHVSCMRNGFNPGLLRAIRCIRSIPKELIAFGYESEEMGVPLSNQLACYNGNNSHYICHRDTPEVVEGTVPHPLTKYLKDGLEDRKITIVLYLNETKWDSSAGGLTNSGNLKCYIDTKIDDMTGATASEVGLTF